MGCRARRSGRVSARAANSLGASGVEPGGVLDVDGAGLAVDLAHQTASAPCPDPLQHTYGRPRMQGGRTTSSQRTAPETWRTSASIAAAPSRFGSASTLATTGRRGSRDGQRRAAAAPAAPPPASSARSGTARSPRAGSPAWRRAPSPRRRPRSTAAARPGDDHLPGRVQVGRRHHLALRRLGARRGDRLGVEAEDRGHRAVADRHGLLHEAAARAHRAHRVGKVERAGGDVRAVLAQAVAGVEVRARSRAPRGRARSPR